MWKWWFSILTVSLFATKAPVGFSGKREELPWMTGPLIAPSSLALKRGEINIEPYLLATANTGIYTSDWKVQAKPTLWNIILEPLMYFGLNDFIDLSFTPSVYYNICQDQKNWAMGDPNFGFDFQLFEDNYYNYDWYPNVKLSLTENFPVGKYDNLNPNKKLTQVGGNGTFSSQIQLVIGKLHYFTSVYFYSHRLAITYIVPTPVKVRGFSVYGGGYGAKAKVYPAQILTLDYGFEVNLSKNWVFASDIIGSWRGKRRFKGTAGINQDGAPASLANGAGFQFSLAPALEYNWNANIGLIFGLWFTAMGKNLPQFYSGVIAFNYFN